MDYTFDSKDDYTLFIKSLFSFLHPTFPVKTAHTPQYRFAWMMEDIYKRPNIKTNPFFNYLLAQYYMINGLNNRANTFFSSAEEIWNGNGSPSFYCDWGKNLYEGSDFELATEKFEYAVKLDPEKWWLYSLWAENISQFENKEEALLKDHQALSLKPKSKDFYINAGYRVILNCYDYNSELNIYIQSANEIGFDPFSFYKELGIKLYKNKYYEYSLSVFQKAIEINPRSAIGISYYAKSLYHNLQYEDAELKFKEADELDYNRELDKEHYELWYFTLTSFDQTEKAMKVRAKLHEVEHPEDEYAEEAEYEEIKDKEINETEKQLRNLFKGFNDTPIDQHNKRAQLFKDLSKNVFNPTVKVDYIDLVYQYEFKNTLEINKYEYSILLNEIQIESGIQFPLLGELFSLIQSKSSTPEKEVKKNTLVLTPINREGRAHRNEINWYDHRGREYTKSPARNNPFDFIYYLAWLNNKDIAGMKINNIMPDEHKSELYEHFSKYARFDGNWSNGDNEQMGKLKSEIKKMFDFEIVLKKGITYGINPDIHIELKPYPTK